MSGAPRYPAAFSSPGTCITPEGVEATICGFCFGTLCTVRGSRTTTTDCVECGGDRLMDHTACHMWRYAIDAGFQAGVMREDVEFGGDAVFSSAHARYLEREAAASLAEALRGDER